jgi:hypothetical protein
VQSEKLVRINIIVLGVIGLLFVFLLIFVVFFQPFYGQWHFSEEVGS